jgi:hypothetical protein
VDPRQKGGESVVSPVARTLEETAGSAAMSSGPNVSESLRELVRVIPSMWKARCGFDHELKTGQPNRPRNQSFDLAYRS